MRPSKFAGSATPIGVICSLRIARAPRRLVAGLLPANAAVSACLPGQQAAADYGSSDVLAMDLDRVAIDDRSAAGQVVGTGAVDQHSRAAAANPMARIKRMGAQRSAAGVLQPYLWRVCRRDRRQCRLAHGRAGNAGGSGKEDPAFSCRGKEAGPGFLCWKHRGVWGRPRGMILLGGRSFRWIEIVRSGG